MNAAPEALDGERASAFPGIMEREAVKQGRAYGRRLPRCAAGDAGRRKQAQALRCPFQCRQEDT